jgi:LysM repeat protein
MDVRTLMNPRVLGASLAVVVALALPAHAARPEAKARRYTVAAGDSLWSIAKAHGCRVDDLRQANVLPASDTLLAGTHLTIPACKGAPAVSEPGRRHRVEVGDTLSAIASRYGTTIADLRALNGLEGDVIHPGQHLTVGAGGAAVRPSIRLVAGQSIGRPQRGALVDGVQLPRSAQYYRRRPEWAYGAQHVVDFTLAAIATVNRMHPKVHRLAIGDISSSKGGFLPGHGSHQSGRDIDLGLYYVRVPAGYPDEFVSVRHARLDAAATWTLVEALYEASKAPGGPQHVFLDYDVQGELYEHARKHGVSRATLAEIFQYPDGRWAQHRLVQHVPKHDDHIHVRFACPPKDAKCR